MPILLLILGVLGLLAIGAAWLQNVTVDGAAQMNVDFFGWTLGPLSHGAWLLVASLFGMLTIACLLGAFALFRRLRRSRGTATATAGASAGHIREDATRAQDRDRDITSRRRDTGRARERATAEDEQVTTGREHAERDTTPAPPGQARAAGDSAEESRTGATPDDVRDNIPHSARGKFGATQDDVPTRTSETAPRATGDDQDGDNLFDKAKEKGKDTAQDAFDRSRNRR